MVFECTSNKALRMQSRSAMPWSLSTCVGQLQTSTSTCLLCAISHVRGSCDRGAGSSMARASQVSRFFLSGGSSGPCVSYQSVLGVEKAVWISNRFKSAHPSLVRVLTHAVSKPPRAWKIIADSDEWAQRAARTPANRARFLALVTKEDKAASGALSAMKFVVTAAECLQLLAKVDAPNSRFGLCGR